MWEIFHRLILFDSLKPVISKRGQGPVGAALKLILGFVTKHIRQDQNVAKKEIKLCNIKLLFDSFSVFSPKGARLPAKSPAVRYMPY